MSKLSAAIDYMYCIIHNRGILLLYLTKYISFLGWIYRRNTISFRGKIIFVVIDSKYGNDIVLVYLNGHKEGLLTFILHMTCIICV